MPSLSPERLALKDRLLHDQDFRCAICKTPLTRSRSHLDHDHEHCARGCDACTRSVLCSNCNMALGLMHDDAERLRRAASYLERFTPAAPSSG
jgi:hypothetical protein